MRHGFTLVELLVVITIIVLLTSMLVPSLEQAVASSRTARCLANEHGMANALALYLGDFNRTYPAMKFYHGLLGSRQRNADFMGAANDLDVPDRPLNAYLGYTGRGGEVPIAHCPSDLGDGHPTVRAENAYRAWGSSYLPAFNNTTSLYRTLIVFGWTANLSAYPSEKASSLFPAHNKLILADWNWWGNRPYGDSPQYRWHNPDPQRREFNTLFADGHAETFAFPKEHIEAPPPQGSASVPYSESFLWW